MKHPIIILLLLVLLNSSFGQHHKPVIQDAKQGTILEQNKVSSNMRVGAPVVPLAEILINFKSFWNYYSKYIQLYNDFTALDQTGKQIARGEFLKRMTTGNYLPLLVYGEKTGKYYQLVEIPKDAESAISLYMKDFSKTQLVFYQMEGKQAPAFDFVDLNGNRYTSANTKGKVILFKCWFISCVPCVQEMPELNQLVKKYSKRKDVLFISLALDKKSALQDFLKKTRFDYITIPDQDAYIRNQLKVSSYPMHFLLNKAGELVHVFPNADELDQAIQQVL